VTADAVADARNTLASGFDDRQRRGIGARAQRALFVVVDADGQRERGDRGRDGTRAHAAQLAACSANRDLELDALFVAFLEQVMRVVGHVEIGGEVGRFEQRPELLRSHLRFRRVHLALHERAEFHLHAPRHHHAVVAFEKIGNAALARLTVHADDAVVGAAEIRRIHRDVRHFPDRIGLLRRHALLDRILVRAGKRREHEIADVGMTRMNR